MDFLIVLGLSFAAWLAVCIVEAVLRIPQNIVDARESREWQRRVAEHKLGEKPSVTEVR
jgi:hypothetical protein